MATAIRKPEAINESAIIPILDNHRSRKHKTAGESKDDAAQQAHTHTQRARHTHVEVEHTGHGAVAEAEAPGVRAGSSVRPFYGDAYSFDSIRFEEHQTWLCLADRGLPSNDSSVVYLFILGKIKYSEEASNICLFSLFT
jgi:hypothetical protein